MQTLSEIKALLESRGLSPRKSLGQNFLIDKNLIHKLLDASGIGRPGLPGLVLEVGPGTGTLTEALLERRCRVVAVELDRGLAALLRERGPAMVGAHPGSSLEVIEGDCLAGPGGRAVNPEAIAALGQDQFALVANLPYGAATPLLMALLINHPACVLMAVTIQKEVGARLGARPGTKDYGTLSVVAQTAATIEAVAELSPECFWPRPDIRSAMVILRRRATVAVPDLGALATFCQRLLGQRRKQIGRVLGRDVPLPAGVEARCRPDTLTVAQIVELQQLVTRGAGPPDSGSDPVDERPARG